MKHRKTTACLIAAAALAGGCSVSGITPGAENPAAPAEWVRGGDAGIAGVNWLTTFNNPQLESLVGEAVANNYFLQQERERLELARQGVIVTRSNRFPTLEVSIDGRRTGAEDTTGSSFVAESFDASVSARWDVDIWRRLSKQQQAAELELAAQRARLEAVERDIAGRTASQLFNAMAATQLLHVAKRRLSNVVESHDIVASGYRQGLNDALDLYLARNQLELQQANYAQQQQALLESIADLQLSLARYPDGQMPIPGVLPIIDDAIPAGLPSDLLTRRPDIQEAWLSLLAADADLAAAHRARFPSLNIVGSDGVTSSEFSDLLSSGASAWSLSFGLTQPLFNAGRLKAAEAQALAQVRIAEQQYLDLVYQAFADVENAISRSASLTERYRALVEAEKNSRAALELALEQYQRGLVTYTTVLESQRQAFDAETTVVQLRNQRLQNRITLYLALGGEFQ